MDRGCEETANAAPAQAGNGEATMQAGGRRLDLLAFALAVLVVTVTWLPTLASGARINRNEDFLLHAARHEALRKSLLEHGTFPLRSHWFGGGYPTLGEPEDPALNPLVLLSLVFGSVMGLKLIAFLAALASALGTYALARYILEYTRWGALFSALIVGTSLYVVDRMESGSLTDVCPAYIPLCMLLVGLSCRGRTAALFLLPFVLYTMVSDGKQSFFVAVLYVGLFCALDALPAFRSLAPETAARKADTRPLQVLAVALGVTFLVGAVRLLPVLEFIGSKGGLMHLEPRFHAAMAGPVGITWQPLLERGSAILGRWSIVTVGWLPIGLFLVSACWFRRSMLPWVIAVVLSIWLSLADNAPLNLFALLERLPVFNTIKLPYKYFAFPLVLSVAVGSGQFLHVLSRLKHRWLEHLCAVVLILGGVGLLYPMTTSAQRGTYTVELPSWAHAQQEEFFNIQGLGLPRKRTEPLRAVGYLNVLQNIGTVDWYAALPIAENAAPRYFVTREGRYMPNPAYQGEAFFDQDGQDVAAHPPGSVRGISIGPNVITVHVTVRQAGILMVNQNYHPAWRTDRGELLARGGLIALRLDETGSYSVRLRYRPRSFIVGLAVSTLSIVGWVLACWTFCARRLQRWEAADGTPPPGNIRADAEQGSNPCDAG